ncbi:hypothetical protein ACE41H_08520 [Paenibacillus enshidis]|uniref:Uncharacterized protein n=1 Tax=Paenibacillus enshidis TaxID=1458439 RepID=A0ABV5AS42_9BACL
MEEDGKPGIVIKDQLKVAMIDMDKYRMIVNALQEYERISYRLEGSRIVEYKEGMSLLEMAGVHPRDECSYL